MAQQLRLGQTKTCPLSRAVSRKVVVGLPAMHFAKRTKTSAFFGKNSEARASEVNASQMPALASSMEDLSQHTSAAGGFHQEVVSALHMTSPANVIYSTQTRFTGCVDRPALGPGQALGFVLAAAGVYVAMLISAFFYGKTEKKLNWKQNKFQDRTFKTFTSKARSLSHPRVLLSKRPYVQHVLQVSNLLLQSDPPSKLKRYPARVQYLAAR